VSKELRIAIIGAGYFSQFHLTAWQRIEGVAVVAIVDHDTAKHSVLREQHPEALVCDTVEHAFENSQVDIVDIVTPPSTHQALLRKLFALTAQDCIVVCQKPFCESYTQAEQMVQLATQQERTLVVHENFRFGPWYAKIKSLIEQGELGELLEARFLLRPGDGRGETAYLDRQPYFRSMPRFLIHETGIHWIDTFRYLFGEPDSVYADLRKINRGIAGEDAGFFVFSYANGMCAQFSGNRNLDHVAKNKRLTMGEMTIEGTRSTLMLNGDGELSMRYFNTEDIRTIPIHYDPQDFGGGAVLRLNTHIVAHIREQSPLQNTASDYLRNLQLENLIYESAQQGRRLPC